MEHLSITQLRANIASHVIRVVRTREPIIVTLHNEPAVMIKPVDTTTLSDTDNG